MTIPSWMPLVMRLAGLYNLGYCLLLTFYPSATFRWLGMPETPDVMIRCIGMMVGVYALCYWIAGSNPMKYWPLVAVGIVGKTLGPLGFVYGLWSGIFAWQGSIMILFNDVVWWVPFWLIVLRALQTEPNALRATLLPGAQERTVRL